eukprot:859643-Rhodomonas_salina.2
MHSLAPSIPSIATPPARSLSLVLHAQNTDTSVFSLPTGSSRTRRTARRSTRPRVSASRPSTSRPRSSSRPRTLSPQLASRTARQAPSAWTRRAPARGFGWRAATRSQGRSRTRTSCRLARGKAICLPREVSAIWKATSEEGSAPQGGGVSWAVVYGLRDAWGLCFLCLGLCGVRAWFEPQRPPACDPLCLLNNIT